MHHLYLFIRNIYWVFKWTFTLEMWFIPSWTNRFKPHPHTGTCHLSGLTSSPSNNTFLFTDVEHVWYCHDIKIGNLAFWLFQNSKWVWSGNTTITNRRQPPGTARKSSSTITRHQEDKLSKATSSLFPIKMIAILEWTQSNVQQNIEQLQTPTMRVTINKKSTTTEPPP